MNSPHKLIAFLILAFQTCMVLVYAQYGDGGVIGYTVSRGTVITIVCAASDYTFDTSTTYSDDTRTFGYCGPTTQDVELVGTSCDGDDIVYTGWNPDIGGDNPTGTTTCDLGYACATATVYEYYEDGYAYYPRYYIGCADSYKPTRIMFLEEPTEEITVVTEQPKNTPPDDTSTLTETSTTEPEVEDITTTITLPPTSEPTKKTDGGLGGGEIAGIVIGSIAGICLIAGAIILAFRYGRRTTDQEGGEPRPTSYVSTWTNPTQGPSAAAMHNNAPVLQMSTADAGVTTKPEGGSWVASPVSPVSKSPVHNSPPPINVQTRPVAQPPFIGAELPTSLESQGWARSETHPLPYEADSSVAYMPYRPPPRMMSIWLMGCKWEIAKEI
ncbi:hypothetical protein NM208_g6334 [Fusarium decemcellulare]|uniref:Uncharacterized protein n=1 Tax=Fusarium decemcellulare TaxID=57161 RepID=A0ACC1SDC7_9HYPO|nr:hypothetical protein NM208_g6334 [Fusarium decemcellulare]